MSLSATRGGESRRPEPDRPEPGRPEPSRPGPGGAGRGRTERSRAAPGLVAAGAGALAAAGQAPFGLWAGTLVGLAGLSLLVAAAPSGRAAARLGWLGGTGYFAAALFWIVEPFLVDPARHGWMAPFALALMAMGLALFWGGAAALAHGLGRGAAGRAGAFAVTLAAAELLRGHVLTGFPWAHPGHVWIDTPVAQLAALIGASGLTLATLAAAALPVAAWHAGPHRAPQARRALHAAGAAAAVAALTAAAWGWGAHRLAQPLPPRDAPVTLRLVQPNAPQHLKWRRDLAHVFLERKLDLTRRPAETPPDLIVWPETAIPWLLDDAAPILPTLAAAARGAPLALGVQRDENGRYFNSLAVLDPTGAPIALYDKHHLVPFGEYIPFADLLAGVPLPGLAGQALLGYTPGPGPALIDLGPLGRVRPLICYEAIFPAYAALPERPDWVLQITNDAWFGRLSGPWQHLALARFRAIEQGLPLARAANTGVSAVIDPRGQLTAALGLGRTGTVDAALPAALPPTPFARTGEAPLAALLALALGALALRRRRPVDATGPRG